MENILIDTSLTVAAAIKMYIFFGLGLNKKDQQMKVEAKVNEYYEQHKEIEKSRSTSNMLRWIFSDGFILEHFTIGTLYHKKLETVKSEFLKFFFTEVIKNKKEIKTNEQIHTKIDEYMLKIMKLRMIIEPSIQIATNVHTQSKITYLIAKSFWYDEDGNKIRKFTKSLGRAEEYKKGTNDINAKIEADSKIKDLMIQTYKDEYGE
jgi:hypothetical protein